MEVSYKVLGQAENRTASINYWKAELKIRKGKGKEELISLETGSYICIHT